MIFLSKIDISIAPKPPPQFSPIGNRYLNLGMWPVFGLGLRTIELIASLNKLVHILFMLFSSSRDCN